MTVTATVAVLVAVAVAIWPTGSRRRQVETLSHAGWTAATTRAPAPTDTAQTGGITIDDVASTMVLLALALRSGCGLVEAVEAVTSASEGQLRRELASVGAAQRWGIDPVRAWTASGAAWVGVGHALGVASRAGVAPSALLLEAASDLRAEEAAEVEVAAARVGVRLVLPLGLALLPAFCLTSVVPLVLALARQVVSGP